MSVSGIDSVFYSLCYFTRLRLKHIVEIKEKYKHMYTTINSEPAVNRMKAEYWQDSFEIRNLLSMFLIPKSDRYFRC